MRWLLRRLLSDAELRQIEADQSELFESWTRLHGLAIARRRLRRDRAFLVPRLIACVGVVIGLAAGTIVARLLTSQLFGVTRTDQAGGLVAVAVILLAFTVITCGIPGRRASRLNPVSLLRE